MPKAGLSKWSKFKVLQKSNKLAAALPETKRMSKEALWHFMNRYGSVILKPSGGSGGAGVIQVSSEGLNHYKVQIGNRIKTIEGKMQTYLYVKKKIQPHPYIIQCRISLAKINGRPFDLRVMVQRCAPSTRWKVTGRLAKVAGKGFIITNIARSKGTVLPVEVALQHASLKTDSSRTILSKIDTVALQAAKHMAWFYPGIRTFGFDMGIDQQGKVWIIEANFRPVTSLFLKLKDKSMYRRIMWYKKAGGV